MQSPSDEVTPTGEDCDHRVSSPSLYENKVRQRGEDTARTRPRGGQQQYTLERPRRRLAAGGRSDHHRKLSIPQVAVEHDTEHGDAQS